MRFLGRCSSRIIFIVLVFSTTTGFSQDCTLDFPFTPVDGTNSIEWDKFPDFNLPFTLIYNGPRFNDKESRPLKHGFSHLALFSGNEANTLPVKNRAILWNSVATFSDSQPWAIKGLESPWGNDTSAYRSYWLEYLKGLSNQFADSQNQTFPKADIICMDIERIQELDKDILALKRDTRVAQKYRDLSDNAFLAMYKTDIKWWYTEPINFIKNLGLPPSTKLSSYSDVPVRGTWLNIPSNSWQDWTTNPLRTHYLMQDNAGKIGGSFYNNMDFLTPSAYYYYPYDNPLGKDYLSYLLFQIEANRAWSNKDIIAFVWLRYHDSFSPGTPLVPGFMAEATAIFPFFSGAKGLWLWENNYFENALQQNYSTYEFFIKGLYRLSKFSDMFTGNHELVIAQSARDHMEKRDPIWRGVVKDGRILIAAQNTYASETQQTQLTVAYKQWTKTITLNGREVFLCDFNLSDVVNSLDSSLALASIYPNPTQKSVFVTLTSQNPQLKVTFELLDLKGTILREVTTNTTIGDFQYAFDLPTLPRGTYLVRISTESNSLTKRIFIH